MCLVLCGLAKVILSQLLGLEICYLRLHNRRRHVLHLLLHRPLPGCRDLRVRRGQWSRALVGGQTKERQAVTYV